MKYTDAILYLILGLTIAYLLTGCVNLDKHVDQCLDSGRGFSYFVKKDSTTFNCFNGQ